MLLLSRLIVEGERTGDDKFAQELLQRSGEIDGKVSGRTTRVREVLEVHRREQPFTTENLPTDFAPCMIHEANCNLY